MSLDFDLKERGSCVFSTNITHNVNTMWSKAGIYECLYNKEGNFKTAKEILPLLIDGAKKMVENPRYFRQFDADNGWGTYEQALPWLTEVIDACREFPDATIETSY